MRTWVIFFCFWWFCVIIKYKYEYKLYVLRREKNKETPPKPNRKPGTSMQFFFEKYQKCSCVNTWIKRWSCI